MKQAFAQDGIAVQSVVEIADETTGIAMIQKWQTVATALAEFRGANAALDAQIVAQFRDDITQADYLLMQLKRR